MFRAGPRCSSAARIRRPALRRAGAWGKRAIADVVVEPSADPISSLAAQKRELATEARHHDFAPWSECGLPPAVTRSRDPSRAAGLLTGCPAEAQVPAVLRPGLARHPAAAAPAAGRRPH